MNALLVSDVHLTSNARDAYRWGLFQWLAQLCRKYSVHKLFFLGDITEAKDYHSARLVNRLADELTSLAKGPESLSEIMLLRGNHDGLDPRLPYFYFLRHFPLVKFIMTPFMCEYANLELAMLPHTPTPEKDWARVDWLSRAELVFMHQTVRGALAENGQQLGGVSPEVLQQMRGAKIWSGDVHVPQVISGVEYVGAPYAVRFGDKFTPRVVVLENFRKPISIENTWAPKRRFITISLGDAVGGKMAVPTELLDTTFNEGDQVKLRIRLSPVDYVEWDSLKREALAACARLKLEVCGIELERVALKSKLVKRSQPPAYGQYHTASQQPHLVFEAYCAQHDVLGDVVELGASFLSQAQQ